jgi:hypothetical protein
MFEYTILYYINVSMKIASTAINYNAKGTSSFDLINARVRDAVISNDLLFHVFHEQQGKRGDSGYLDE